MAFRPPHGRVLGRRDANRGIKIDGEDLPAMTEADILSAIEHGPAEFKTVKKAA